MLNLNDLSNRLTKRIILSDISRIFDVLGILSSITIRAKCIMQRLWQLTLTWDQTVPNEFATEFMSYRSELEELTNFSLARCLSSFTEFIEQKLIGFYDASTQAYCAEIYIRTVNKHGKIDIRSVCAKTKVAPLKNFNYSASRASRGLDVGTK